MAAPTRRLLFAIALLVGIAAATGAAGAVIDGGPPAQVAECSASPTLVEPDQTVTLDASSSDASFVEFDKQGDGNFEQTDETDFIVNVTYAEVGTYNPQARANEGESTDTDQCGEVTVTDFPTASLSVSPNPATTEETVTLNASESTDPDGEIVEYRWDTNGDGTVDRTTDTPTIDETYSSAGTYQVTVTVVDDDGATDTATRDLVVETPAVAECSASPTLVAPDETVTLDASGSDANFVEFDKRGDGEFETPDETDFIIDVSYAEVGTYSPQVRANKQASTDTAQCGEVTVTDFPNASLSVSPNPATTGETVTLDASESTDPDGSIVEYRWDTNGDGTVDRTTDTASIDETYNTAGTYTVSVTVVDDDGATDTAQQDLTVEEPATVQCSASPTLVAPDETVTLDASGSDANFVEFDKQGDGEFEQTDETDFTVDVTYAEVGTYGPVARADGETTDQCGEVTVTDFPTAELTVSPNPVPAGDTVTLDASGSTDPDGSIVEYQWNFDGDGNVDRTTTSATTQYTYTQADSYVPAVTVVDDDGATANAEQDLRVLESVVAECTVEPTSVAPGDTVVIDATGSQNAQVIDYDTDGDGTYEELERTEFTLDVQAGETSFTPRVRVRNGDRQDTAECGTVTVEQPNEPPQPELSISPRPGIVGQSVTFDASGSTDPDGSIVEYRWDFDGDRTVDRTTSGATTTYTFQQGGSYVPSVTVVDDDNASRSAETDYRVREPTPTPTPRPTATGELRCSVSPTTVGLNETVTVDASESTGIEVVDFDLNGDGTYDELERTDMTATVVYTEALTYEPVVRVHGTDRVASCGTVTVEGNQPPNAAFTVDPRTPAAGVTVTFDASGSSDPDGSVVEYRWDFDGDGTVDRTTNATSVQHTYSSTGLRATTLTVVDDDGATDSSGLEITVSAGDGGSEQPQGHGSDIPWVPIGAGGAGALGLGGLLYHFFGGGGGAGGTKPKPDPDVKPKPKPSPGKEDKLQYETGIFALPMTSGTVSVPVGFEPDLILISVVNGARTDPAVDRTAGASFGVVHRTSNGLTNQCQTVADDAQNTDQATCAIADDLAVQVVRHHSSDPPGRVTGRVTDTSSDGFDLDVSIPGDDPLAGGVRVLYQAFATPSDIDVEMGFFETPTEPGTQTVQFGFDADHVSLTASAAVSDTDQLWTTNRGVGVSMGNAVAANGSVDQTVWGTSAWPEVDHATAAVCGIDRALYLLYQDGERIAGRTRASVTDLGTTLRLQYDRVYNGPHKLGSTARHPVSYLAMAGGETMRPAVGAFQFPRADERLTVDCGFEPAMVEFFVTDAPIGEEVAGGASARPLDISHGTAIDTGDGLRQYVLHHSVSAEPPAARSDVPTADATAGESGQTAADGGQSPGRSAASAGTESDAGGRESSATDAVGDVSPADVPETGVPAMSGSGDGSTGGSQTAPDPKATTDDGRAGLWLPQAPDGTIIGRDELRVQRLTASGFDVTTQSIDTDDRSGTESRPTVVYRAWPAVDADPTSESSGGGSAGSSGSESSQSDSPGPADGAMSTTGGSAGGGSPD